ncbi:MAG: hypothetical protein RLZZ565_1318, partial [Planctomycetota bacterium]
EGSGIGGGGGRGGRGGGRGGPGSTSGPRFDAGPGGINPNATVGRGSRSSRLGSTRPANGGS